MAKVGSGSKNKSKTKKKIRSDAGRKQKAKVNLKSKYKDKPYVPRRKRKDGKDYTKSDERARQKAVLVRLTDEEYELLSVLAANVNLKRAPYLRLKGLGDAGPRSKRESRPDEKELARILGQLGKIGSNVNQLAKQANTGGIGTVNMVVLSETLQSVSDMRAVVMEALGYDDH